MSTSRSFGVPASTTSVTSASPTNSAVGDSATSGSATTAARGDHRHGREAFGSVTAQTATGAASSSGSAATVARSDHTHGTPALYSSVPVADGAVGAVGTASSAAPGDHAHPRYHWSAPDHGLKAWTGDPVTFTNSAAPSTAGRMDFARMHLPIAAPVTNIVMGVATAGSGLTSGQCFAALYPAGGTLIAQTADQATAWASTGMKTMALTGGPFALAAGDYYVGFWFNGTTSPAWVRGSVAVSGFINIGLSAPNLRFGTADTGLTTTAPSTIGTQTGSTGFSWWVGLS